MNVTKEYIHQVFGDFWSVLWNEPELLETMVNSYQEIFTQLEGKRISLDDYLSRLHIPLSFFKHFRYLYLTEDRVERQYRQIGTFTMDDGVPMDAYKLSPEEYIIETDLTDVSLIMDRPVNPTVIWQKGQEFAVEEGKIRMFFDPIDAFVTGVKSEDEVLIPAAKLWLVSTELDQQSLTEFFGTYFDLRTASSPYYRKVLNGIWDLAVEGATLENINKYFCAVADTDVAFESGTVQRVWDENERTWVMTDNYVHSAPGGAAAIVSVSDSVQKGQLLFDNVEVHKGTEAITPSQMPMLHAGPEMVSAKYQGGLGFENKVFEITSYRFPVRGNPETVEEFWEDVEARMLEDDVDLWTLITEDQKPPFQINPFDFVRENLYKNNTLFARMDLNTVPDRSRNLKLIGYLLNYMPAGTTFLAFAEAEVETEVLQDSGVSDRDPAAFYVGTAPELENVQINEYINGGQKLY